jgi:hypothetical protein
VSADRSRPGPVVARSLALIERALLAVPFRCRNPVLFVLGLPRSGTTLVSQYLVHRLDLAYFTNGAGRHPGSPLLATALEHLRSGGYRSDFRSDYGKVQGATAPREAGGVWARFFGYERYVHYDDVSPADVRTLRRLVAAVQLVFGGAPFLNKNVKHLLRVHALAQIFPDSRFLVVRRPLADVAVSILRARRKLLDDASQWWSVRPLDYEALRKLPPAEQVAGQVLSLRSRMHADLGGLPASRVLWLDYEGFCREPESAIELVLNAIGDVANRNSRVAAFAAVHNQAADSEEARLVGMVDERAG